MQFGEKLEEGIRSFYQSTFDRWTREIHKWIVPYTNDIDQKSPSADSSNSSCSSSEQDKKSHLMGSLYQFLQGSCNQRGQHKVCDTNNISDAALAHQHNDIEVDAVMDSLDFENEQERETFKEKMVVINQVFHDELEDLRRQHRRLKAEQMLRFYLNTTSKEEEQSETIFQYLLKTLTNRPRKFRIDSKVCRKIVEELLLMDELERVLLSLEKQSIELDNLICDLEIEVHDRILAACKPKIKGLSSSLDSFTKRMHEEGGLKYINNKKQEILLAYSSLPPPLTRENLDLLRQFGRGMSTIRICNKGISYINLSSQHLPTFENLQVHEYLSEEDKANISEDLRIVRSNIQRIETIKEIEKTQQGDRDYYHQIYREFNSLPSAQGVVSNLVPKSIGNDSDHEQTEMKEQCPFSIFKQGVKEGETRTDIDTYSQTQDKSKLIYKLEKDRGFPRTLDECPVESTTNTSENQQSSHRDHNSLENNVELITTPTLKHKEFSEHESEDFPTITDSNYDKNKNHCRNIDLHSFRIEKDGQSTCFEALNLQEHLTSVKSPLMNGSQSPQKKVALSTMQGENNYNLEELEDVLGIRQPSSDEIEADRLPII